jgi:hypothetical protein
VGWSRSQIGNDLEQGGTRRESEGSNPLGLVATKLVFLDPSRSLLRGLRAARKTISKGLILAQNERWRRGLGMQVGRSARGEAQG